MKKVLDTKTLRLYPGFMVYIVSIWLQKLKSFLAGQKWLLIREKKHKVNKRSSFGKRIV